MGTSFTLDSEKCRATFEFVINILLGANYFLQKLDSLNSKVEMFSLEPQSY